ncbi:NAD-dependent epimerase/dehydratase family protein [Streptomyces sp. NPDC001380]|uniref:NAD-dependent epimerase/dehydratase family protein n=1 Tax=Streptomyces sp. NPDC001380 TaxID=3364566 RepID=UPI0036C30A8F
MTATTPPGPTPPGAVPPGAVPPGPVCGTAPAAARAAGTARTGAAVDLHGARCLVTGGAGTIGSAVVDQLLEAGVGEVVVLDNFVRGRAANLARARGLAAADPARLRVVDGDIRDRALLRELLRPATDIVFHLAALRITQCATEPRLALEVLVDGTFDVLEAAAETGVRKVVASSSASVYGLADTFPTPETQHPYNNDTLYGAAKAFNEGLLRSFHAMYGLDYVALRYFNVYGPRMDVHGRYTEVFIRWMERIAAGRPPLIFGDGAQTMDFVYTEDIARANLLAARAPATDRVYNIASASEVSLRGLAEALLAAMDSPGLGVEHGPARDTAGGVVRRLADISAAERDLGWKPELGLEEGLRRLVAWWRGTAAEEASEGASEGAAAPGGVA